MSLTVMSVLAKFQATLAWSGGGGGGANTKVPDMYGGGGVFGTQNTKVTCTLLYNKGGGVHILSRITKV